MEDLNAKRIAINNYREMVACVGTDDPATCNVLENIIVQEEEGCRGSGEPAENIGS